MNDRGNIVIYQTKDGKTSIDVKLENETVWLTQAQMAELFQKDRTVIGRHINNVYREGELERDITCAKIAHVQIEDISHAFLVLMQHLSPLLKPYFSVFPLFYGVFYFRLTIIPRHRNINRTLTSIDILQLLFFFQPFDMSGGSGKRKFAKSLKVRAGQYLVITEIRGQQSVYLFVGAWH